MKTILKKFIILGDLGIFGWLLWLGIDTNEMPAEGKITPMVARCKL